MAKSKGRAVGILTGGGDCPGLSVVIRAAARTALQLGWDVYAIDDGFDGLLRKKARRLTRADLRGPIAGGSLLASTNRTDPFEYPVRQGRTFVETDRSAEVVRNTRALGLAGIITVGGDGTLAMAERFRRKGLPVVGVPKAIENDLPSTALTFGFDTAVAVAADAIEKIHPTAEARKHIMVVEVLGRNAGWLALHTALASGVDVVLLPEIPFKIESVVEGIRARERAGIEFSIVVVAEGAIPIPEPGKAPRSAKAAEAERRGAIGPWLAADLARRLKKEARCVDVGPLQRGGPPSSFDRFVATRFGTAAMRLVDEGLFGNMVAFKPPAIVPVPLHQVVDRVRLVPLDSDVVRSARDLGIGFGD